jgi:hypothetical protein
MIIALTIYGAAHLFMLWCIAFNLKGIAERLP